MKSFVTQNLFTLLKCMLLSGVLLISIQSSNAQSVGINTLSPDESAALDIQSTTGGLLIPRMTTAQITALTNPADGLLIFDTDKQNTVMFVQGAVYDLYNRVATTAFTILSGITPSGWASVSDIAPAELLGLTIHRFQLDLTNVREMRLIANITGLTLGLGSGLDMLLQYSTNNGTTWSSLNSASFGPGLSISVNGLAKTPWTTIDAGAQTDVMLRIVGQAQGGVVTQVGVGLVMVEMR
ncbi:hypothetical protein H0I23_03030 [Cellulophaga sp. HaHaR_3_176]|uniref:hypothetical protein n=1 Tax=Cellulophaga sp. HaHaR_3_176 TaxID=1942464 RepID=UPI001C1F8D16|nr:hypothetical protein [Cellulophaga sp. HaHaR_3_176]QWX84634.1 hypothetical protein H0I23_03030 [Cellulophaga sp. HaHaR_3_176]